MSAYIEVEVKGNHRAYIEAGSIVGVIHSPGLGADDVASPDTTMTIILRGGDSLEEVYGISPARLILYATGARWMLRHVRKSAVGTLLSIERRATFEDELFAAKQQMEMERGGAS